VEYKKCKVKVDILIQRLVYNTPSVPKYINF